MVRCWRSRPLRCAPAGLRRLTDQPGYAGRRICSANLSGGRGEVADVLAGIAAAEARGLRADQDQLRGPARRQRRSGIAAGRTFPRQRPHRAFHRIHGCGHRATAGARPASCRRAELATASTHAGRCGRWIRIIGAKWRRATRSTTAVAKSASSVRLARLSAAIVIAPAFRRKASCTRVCSRARAGICGRCCRQGEAAFSEHVADLWSRRGIVTASCAVRAVLRASTSRCS